MNLDGSVYYKGWNIFEPAKEGESWLAIKDKDHNDKMYARTFRQIKMKIKRDLYVHTTHGTAKT